MSEARNVTLRPVTDDDTQFLYDLLAQRDPIANISHRRMPTMAEHVAFMRTQPYTAWMVVLADGKRVGSIYLSHTNEIGLHLLNDQTGHGYGTDAIAALVIQYPRERYFANVAPGNVRSREFFERHGFRCIQHTLECSF
jgi:RimJ/RimL family protein N-acetyltransferase